MQKIFILPLISVILMSVVPSKASKRYFDVVPGAYNHLITDIHRHSNGMVLLGTSTGLCRYDGYSILPVQSNLTDSATVINDYILKITEDSKGRLWIKTQSRYGLYDPNNHHIEDNFTDILSDRGINGKIIEMEVDSDGSIWIATDNNELYQLPKDGGKANKIAGVPTNGYRVTCLKAKDDEIICVDETGIITRINTKTLIPTTFTRNPHILEKNGKQEYQLTIDSKNRYWIYCAFTVEVFDANSNQWISDLIHDKDRHSNIRTIYQDRAGSLWIARDNHGLELIHTDENGIQFVTIDRPEDVTHKNSITCFMEDAYGSFWMGTYKMGLLTHNNSVHKFDIELLPDVNCMLPAGDNWVWAGTDSSGLWKWNTSTGDRVQYKDISEGDSPAAITCLHAIGNDLYIGSFFHGLRRLRGDKIEKVNTATDLDNSYIWSLASDKFGQLWISTLGGGIYRLDPLTGETTYIKNAANGLQSPFVVTEIASKDGRVYFGNAYGIAYHDPSDGLIHNLKDLNPEFNTDGWRMTQLFEDSRGLIWAATSNGLKVIDRTHSKVSKVKTGNDSYNNYITGITEDNGGSIWISEGRSLINLKINYDDKTGELTVSPRPYDTRDGLIDSDFNQRSLTKLPSGEILVGGLRGVNKFFPSELEFNTLRPKVIFTDLYIGDKLVLPGEKIDGTTVIDTGLYYEPDINLTYDTPDFTIYFTTDNYALPEKTTYRYCLEGYSNEWRALKPGLHSVTYTNLSPGTYRLLVIGINGDGFESMEPAAISITVHPPFWQSNWAIAIYIILAIFVVWGIVKIIERLERKRYEKKMEEEERKKQEEVNQLKFKFFTNVSHDLRTPLTLIVSPLEEMMKETSDQKQKERLSLMRVNATKLLTLVNQLLDFRKNEVAGLQLNATEDDVVGFSRNVCESFSAITERKNVALSFFSDHESINMLFDRDKLEKILMNLLGNAFKFTPVGGKVDVSLEQVGNDNPVLRIKVADTGIGIKDKDKERIFERFYQVDDNGNSHPHMGSGIGLSMVSEYVKLHHGTVRVTDNVGCGSVFIIDIPIRHALRVTEESINKKDNFIPASASMQEEELASSSSAAHSSGEKTVALVVDDNPDMTDMLKFELERDFDVVTASDGNEALKILKDITPSIILTDLMMPGMNGIELCRKLKSNPDTVAIPIIILSAKHDLGVKIEGLTLGADDYITKPFNLDVLRLRMKRLVQLTAKGATRTLVDPEPESIKITPFDEKFIEKAMKYVSDNIDSSQLSVEELSDHLGMSRVRLYKKIKQITGKTPIEFIRIIRLKRAAQFLRESQLNVSEIAYQTGFNNPKLFSKYFKEEFGILPSVYQDQEGKETNYTV